MASAFAMLWDLDGGIALMGVIVLVGWAAGVGQAICFGILPLRDKQRQTQRFLDEANLTIGNLYRESERRARMLIGAEASVRNAIVAVGTLNLANKVDATRATTRKGAA